VGYTGNVNEFCGEGGMGRVEQGMGMAGGGMGKLEQGMRMIEQGMMAEHGMTSYLLALISSRDNKRILKSSNPLLYYVPILWLAPKHSAASCRPLSQEPLPQLSLAKDRGENGSGIHVGYWI
jgi:hypothetical protein